jgi:hypothetical protein
VISDRRGAPGRLGSLFNRLPKQQLGIGFYESVSGTPAAPGPAEQTLIGVVQVSAPAGPYTVWAERIADVFAEQPSRDRLLYVLTDQQLAASERMIGQPPAYLAVLIDRPGDSSTIAAAFADTRYVWVKTEAIYSQADPNRVPKMTFLHWAELRPIDEWKGRSGEPHDAAHRLGGTLVFPVEVPVSGGDRERPQGAFTDAFAAQFPGGDALLPQVVSAPEQGSATVASQRAAGGALLVLGIFGCGVIAVWAGKKFVEQMRGQTA